VQTAERKQEEGSDSVKKKMAVATAIVYREEVTAPVVPE
jgi:hypothetical protein